jgi:hypothetical protein
MEFRKEATVAPNIPGVFEGTAPSPTAQATEAERASKLATPDQIARQIVDGFSWTSNLMRDGRLIGQQFVVAEAIAEAIRKDRASVREQERARVFDECAKIAADEVAEHNRLFAKIDDDPATTPTAKDQIKDRIAARALTAERILKAIRTRKDNPHG